MIFVVKTTCIKEVIKDKQVSDISLDIPTRDIALASKVVNWIASSIERSVSDYKMRHIKFNVVTIEKGSRSPFINSENLDSYLRYSLSFECRTFDSDCNDATTFIIKVLDHCIKVFMIELIYDIQKYYFLSCDTENKLRDNLVKECILKGYSSAFSTAEALELEGISNGKFNIPSVTEIELISVSMESVRIIDRPIGIQSDIETTYKKLILSENQNNDLLKSHLDCYCKMSLSCELNFDIKTE